MNFILFDSLNRNRLFPLTFTRPCADIRIGILTIREKWEKYLNSKTSTLTESYLQEKFPIKKNENNILINGSICPNKGLVDLIVKLKDNQVIMDADVVIAFVLNDKDLIFGVDDNLSNFEIIYFKNRYLKISNTWDIFAKNEEALIADFNLLCKDRKSAIIDSSNRIRGTEQIFVEEGAIIQNSVLNATKGPIYIGKDAEIMDGALIRGPFALCDYSTVKMGAKIYGATTVGPNCKVGGELNNVVIFAYSNKGHDGFLGNAVIGEWCNIGADTNNSNLKNTYEEVKLWNYADKHFVKTGLQFCGLIMGDHSKCGINTMFNTGTVVGVSSNIFGSGFQRNFIPSFSWGGASKMDKYNLQKAIITSTEVFKRRNRNFNQIEINLFNYIYNLSIENRYI